MQKSLKAIFSTLVCFTFLFTLSPLSVQAQTVTSNQTGTHGGYNFEYWKDNGNGTMVLKDGGAFSCEWSNINNILFRKGLKYNETQTHQQIGNMSMTYACNYQPNGNSYLSVYGWTSDPLVEYYIIESWGTWKPPGNVQSKGTVTIDGGVYDIFETTRTQQPSIKGTATFQQYWSVRQQKRSSGTISVSDHFKAWEAKGMKMGKFYEISLVVEGYQSSGKADVTKMSIDIGGNPNPPTTPTNPTPTPPVTEKSAFTTIEAEDYNSTNSSTLESIGTGVGYIENGNYLVYNKINFSTGAGSFKAKVANGNTTATTIELRTGSSSGTLIGSLVVPSTGDWDAYEELSTSTRVSSTKDLYLCFSGPVNIDSFIFSSADFTPPTNTTPPPPTTAPPTPIDPGTKLLGDVDQNGELNSLDFAMYRQYLLGTRASIPSEGDIDKNGSMNSIDFAMLRQHLLGIINLGTSTPTVTQTPTSAPIPKGTIKIMPLGDSITDGLTVAGGYRIKLWEQFKSIGASVDFVGSMSNGPGSLGDKNHEGHSGWTISQIDEKINGWMDTYKPQIVLLHIGTNDMYQKPTGASDRLGTLIDKICAKLPAGGKLYVSNIIPFTMYDVTAYNATIPGIVQQKAGQGKPVYFVEMYKALTTSDLADGVHPNATGYNKMADVWFNAIKGELAN